MCLRVRTGLRARTSEIRYRRGIVKDWKAIAKGTGLNVPAEELERIEAPLNGLEEVFRPLVKDLPPDLEPATFLCEGGE